MDEASFVNLSQFCPPNVLDEVFCQQEMEEVERAAITSMIEFLVGSPCCLLGGALWVFDEDEEGLGLHHV